MGLSIARTIAYVSVWFISGVSENYRVGGNRYQASGVNLEFKAALERAFSLRMQIDWLTRSLLKDWLKGKRSG